jgi:hypothetical protein
MSELESIMGLQELTQRLQAASLQSVYATRYDFYANPKPVDGNEADDLDAKEQAFPKDRKTSRTLPAAVFMDSRDWRGFCALGGMDMLETAITALKMNGGAAAKARTNFTAAYAALREASAMNLAGQAVDQTDTDAKAVEAELAYVRRIEAELPPNAPQRQQIALFAQTVIDGSAQQKKALRDLRVATVDAVVTSRRPLIRDIKNRIEAAIDDAQDEVAADTAKDHLAEFGEAMVNFNSGGVLGSTALFNNWLQRYP